MVIKCRACLATTEAKMYHSLLTVFPEYTKTNLTVLDLLGIVTGTNVNMSDGIPDSICTACLKQLKDCYNFIIQFKDAQLWLQENFGQDMKDEMEKITVLLNSEGNDIFLENVTIREYKDKNIVNQKKAVKTIPTIEVRPKPDKKRNVLKPLKKSKTCPIMMSVEDVLIEDGIISEHSDNLIHTAVKNNNDFVENEEDIIIHNDHTYQKNAETSSNPNKNPFVMSVNDVLNATTRTRKKKTKGIITQSPDLVENLKAKTRIRVQKQTADKQQGQTFLCDVCLKVYDSHKRLVNHKWNVHIPDDLREKFKCPICGLASRTRSAFQHHQLKHKGKNYSCDVCGKLYLTPSKIKEHKSRVHGEGLPAKFLCPQCGLRFKFKTALKYHVMSRHQKKNRPYMCRYCGFQCIQKSYLNRHERCHTDERPYKCKYCEKAFRGSGELSLHQLIHEGKYKYMCIYCNKGFLTTWNMRMHWFQHGGNYKCEICNRNFIEATVLNFHYLYHHKLKKADIHAEEAVDINAKEAVNINDKQDNLITMYY